MDAPPPVAPSPSAPSTLAWVDATAGVAGDMLAGALVDLGVELGALQAAVDAVVPATVRLRASSVTRAHLRATKVDVELLVSDQPHRSWGTIRHLLEQADVAPGVRGRALQTFGRLAAAEGAVHGVAPDDVEFHEVGAWDSIADVVAVCAGLDALGVTELVVSRLALGSGSVRSAHGELAVPGPAVLALARGLEVESGGSGELATPTGVALLVAQSSAQGPLPAMTVTASGLGAGSRDRPERANVVRLVLGQRSDGELEMREMALLEANVDDLDPRVWPTVLDALLAAGAADAWLTPVLMKKGRPAHVLSVLSRPEHARTLRDLILDQTSTLGVRESRVRRWALDRGWVDVTVDGHPVAVKVALRDRVVVHAAPEFEDVRGVAARTGRPVRAVLEEASSAAVAAGLVRGGRAPEVLRTRLAR